MKSLSLAILVVLSLAILATLSPSPVAAQVADNPCAGAPGPALLTPWVPVNLIPSGVTAGIEQSSDGSVTYFDGVTHWVSQQTLQCSTEYRYYDFDTGPADGTTDLRYAGYPANIPAATNPDLNRAQLAQRYYDGHLPAGTAILVWTPATGDLRWIWDLAPAEEQHRHPVGTPTPVPTAPSTIPTPGAQPSTTPTPPRDSTTGSHTYPALPTATWSPYTAEYGCSALHVDVSIPYISLVVAPAPKQVVYQDTYLRYRASATTGDATTDVDPADFRGSCLGDDANLPWNGWQGRSFWNGAEKNLSVQHVKVNTHTESLGNGEEANPALWWIWDWGDGNREGHPAWVQPNSYQYDTTSKYARGSIADAPAYTLSLDTQWQTSYTVSWDTTDRLCTAVGTHAETWTSYDAAGNATKHSTNYPECESWVTKVRHWSTPQSKFTYTDQRLWWPIKPLGQTYIDVHGSLHRVYDALLIVLQSIPVEVPMDAKTGW